MKRWFILCIMLWSGLISVSQAAESPARLRVIHAVPDAAMVDILLNGEVAFEGVAFANVTDYLPLEPQSYDLKIQLSATPGAYIWSDMITLSAGQDYTLAAVGKLVLFEAMLLPDAPIKATPDNVQLRLIHLSPNAPTLDMLAKNGVEASLFNETGFKDATNYIPLQADSYDVTMKVAGTSVMALETPNIELVGGRTYSLFVVGLAGGEPALQIVLQTDTVVPATGIATVSEEAAATEEEESEQAATVSEEAAATEEEESEPAAKPDAEINSINQAVVTVDTKIEPIVETSETTTTPPAAEPVSLSVAQLEALSQVDLQTEQQLIPAEVAPDTMPVTGNEEAVELVAVEPVVATVEPSPAAPSTLPLFFSLIVIGMGFIVGVKAIRSETSPNEAPHPETRRR